MTEINAVFFDCDGVLVDSEKIHYEAFQRVLKPWGINFDFKVYQEKYIGFDDRDAFVEIAKDFYKRDILKDLRYLIEAKNKALKECVEKGIQTFDGVIEFVKDLYQAGIPLAVVSGSLKNEVDLFLAKMGIKHLFKFSITANDVLKSKPHPESYQKAFNKMASFINTSIRKDCCVVFEDTPSGIQAARSAGLFTIAITNSFPEQALKNANYIISSFEGMDSEKLLSIVKKTKEREG